MLVIDADGWAASFKDGRWHVGILFSHDEIREMAQVRSEDEGRRLLGEARESVEN